eukprot:TRINITY_DN13_c0_g2_i1.p1 TRINITY_DN13_c0_g2~~TRINITY_DN13_c0_g2_i1.p1  ORF type:complete len:240 (+),score=41.43 TRINITY_DN13_c0_g2_i1:39-722(+)
MPTLQQCLASSNDFRELRKLAHPNTRLACGKPKKFGGGVKTWTKVSPGTGLHILLGEIPVESTVQEFKAALNFERRVHWDDLFEGGKDICAYRSRENEKLEIYHRYMSFRSPVPSLISARDFEVLVSEQFEEGGSFICKAISVTPPTRKTPKGVIRGEILTTGFIVTPTSPTSINVIYIAQIDPKGWIPASVVNVIVSSQAKSIQNLKQYILKNRATLRKIGSQSKL